MSINYRHSYEGTDHERNPAEYKFVKCGIPVTYGLSLVREAVDEIPDPVSTNLGKSKVCHMRRENNSYAKKKIFGEFDSN